MYKFFIEPNQVIENKILLLGEDVNHICHVLRLKKGDKIEVCDKNSHNSYEAEIIEFHKEKIEAILIEQKNQNNEPNTYIHIFQGIPKADKMETIIQKVTEIGVSEITPVRMKRCIAKIEEKSEAKKIQRWQKIAEVAAKQSKRDKIPIINFSINLKNLYEKVKDYDIVIVAYEEEKNQSIKQVLQQFSLQQKRKIAILIGTEGGIDKSEIEELTKKIDNLKIVTLGKRILRTETAPMVLSSVILYEFDEME